MAILCDQLIRSNNYILLESNVIPCNDDPLIEDQIVAARAGTEMKESYAPPENGIEVARYHNLYYSYVFRANDFVNSIESRWGENTCPPRLVMILVQRRYFLEYEMTSALLYWRWDKRGGGSGSCLRFSSRRRLGVLLPRIINIDLRLLASSKYMV